jgi:opacity protein-like surface antigen
MKSLRKNATWILLVGFLFWIAQAEAGSGARTGTAGGQELLIPVGGVGIAMGGSYASGIRGVEAIYWNPAGIPGFTGSTEAIFSHMNYLASINVEYAAVAAKLGGFGTMAFSVQSLGFGDIPVTTVELPDGTGDTYSPTYLTLGLSYARQMTDKIYFGATAKLVTESILRESANGVAFDFGLQYHSSVAGLKFGVVMKNIGPTMKFSGPDLEQSVQLPGTEPGAQPRPVAITAQGFDLPTTLEFGASYDYGFADNSRITLSGSFLNHNYQYDDFKLGAEVMYNDLLFLRGGYLMSPDTPTEDRVFGFSAGGGLKFKVSENLNVAFDYAYRSTDFFADNQVFAVRVGF